MAAGVEFAAYPKFVANFEFERSDDWITCRLSEGESHILTLTGRRLGVRYSSRARWHAFTVRNGRLLRSEVISGGRGMAVSKAPACVRLELGDHPIAKELRGLGVGRMLAYQNVPEYQTVLTPVIESLPI